jgi:HSP20 family protein
MAKKELGIERRNAERDPFTVLRQMTTDFDRFFEGAAWPWFQGPAFRARPRAEVATWVPGIDVFQRDNRLVTRVDLPGMKKEEVKVEVTNGYLVVSGERKNEAEEKTENFYRCEREYGHFYRAVPLPEGVKYEDVKATFANGLLEVSVPLPAKAEPVARKVEVEEGAPGAKAA